MSATVVARVIDLDEQPAFSPSPEFSLSRLVRAALAGDEADPHAIAESLIASMSLADARLALAATLPDYVRKSITRSRGASPAPRSAKWDNVAQLYASGELELLRLRVFASGAWKFLGDCSRDDVKDLAAQREAEAAANAAASARFKALGAAMTRRKASMVSDLPADVLKGIFNA